MPRPGGNSEKASSGINGARTKAQIKLFMKDSVEEFYKYAEGTHVCLCHGMNLVPANVAHTTRDTIASGKGLCNPELVDILVKQSSDAHDFLTSFGIDLSVVTKLGGAMCRPQSGYTNLIRLLFVNYVARSLTCEDPPSAPPEG